jgi:hypothetical protein
MTLAWSAAQRLRNDGVVEFVSFLVPDSEHVVEIAERLGRLRRFPLTDRLGRSVRRSRITGWRGGTVRQ